MMLRSLARTVFLVSKERRSKVCIATNWQYVACMQNSNDRRCLHAFALSVLQPLPGTHLIVLDMDVGLAGCQALAETLPVMPYLSQLCLSQAQLTDANLQILLHVLKVPCCCG